MKDKRTFFTRYWWVFAGVLSAVAVSTALNISNTDSWIVVTNPSNDSWVINWNTSRPTTCAAGNYSYWTGSGFSCAPDQTGSVNLSGYVPYTGANQNVNINGYIIQTHGVRSTDSAGLLIESASGTDSAVFGVANTANILFYGSLDMSTGTNICLNGVCRSTWPADTYANVTIVQADITAIKTVDNTQNNSIASVSTFAQTKASTGSATSSTQCLQNLTITNNSWTSQYTICGGAGGGVTSVATGAGLTGGPITSTGTISINSPTCGASEYLRWTGTAFVCSTPTGGSGLTEFINYTTSEYATTSNTVYVIMTNLTADLAANSKYVVKCEFLTYSAAVTTGEQLRVNTTGTPTTVAWSFNSQISATTRTSLQGTSTSTNAFADTGSAGTNVRDITLLTGYIATAGSTATVWYEMRSEISASNAAYAVGSWCRYTKVG